MTLDEAIKHCKEVAKNLYAEGEDECTECANEHEQLAGWLEDYKRLLEERTQGDLISRAALKEAMEILFKNGGYDSGLVLNLIDNAPSVDKVVNVYPNGEVIVQEKRPQGEWIDHSDDYGYAECPFCEHLTTCGDNIDELHYCWNCGAELKKGVQND